jgi:hypothetical protein
MEKDKYIGMSVMQVIDKLGSPDFRGDQVIDINYLSTPIEPYYTNYFSKDELEKSVTINVTRWVKGRNNIVVWAKLEEDDWIIFSSLKYHKASYIKY